MRGVIAVVVGIGLMVGGCTKPTDRGPDTTVPTAAPTVPTTPTTTAPDVSKVPETIDEAYVNAVLAALDEVDGQATRIIVAAKQLKPEATERLQAIFSIEQLKSEVELWLTDLAEDPALTGILPSPGPGNRMTTVDRIISADPACLWLAVRRDYTQVNVEQRPVRVEYLALRSLDPRNNPKGYNRTPWMITAEGYRRDGTEPSNPCPSR